MHARCLHWKDKNVAEIYCFAELEVNLRLATPDPLVGQNTRSLLFDLAELLQAGGFGDGFLPGRHSQTTMENRMNHAVLPLVGRNKSNISGTKRSAKENGHD